MLNTEPMLAGNDSMMKQFGAAFAVTHIGALFLCALLVSAGITFISVELGAEKPGWVFLGSLVICCLAIIIAQAVLRKFYVTVLLPDNTGLAGKNYVNFLIQVSGGIVKAVSATALWGKEGMLCLRIPLKENCFHGFPVMTLEKAPLIIPVKYLGFLNSVQIPPHQSPAVAGSGTGQAPVRWQSLYDLAAVNGNMASVGDGLRKRFDEESLKRRLDWLPLIADFLSGKMTQAQFKQQLGLAMIEWDLCPFAPVEFVLETPVIRNKHQVILA